MSLNETYTYMQDFFFTNSFVSEQRILNFIYTIAIAIRYSLAAHTIMDMLDC